MGHKITVKQRRLLVTKAHLGTSSIISMDITGQRLKKLASAGQSLKNWYLKYFLTCKTYPLSVPI